MIERPILMSAPMVRAILGGQKTQTRRVVKPTGAPGKHQTHTGPVAEAMSACPYGQPGDRLWVKETWRVMNAGLRTIALRASPDRHGGHYLSQEGDAWWDRWGARSDGGRWQPSIYMPRWASRITLEVTSVRVERLQDITEADARAEGVDALGGRAGVSDARGAFCALWSSINGPESWDANPWVWVVGFRRGGGA